MTEEAMSLAKSERVVARYDDGSEHRGEVYSNDASELVITMGQAERHAQPRAA